MPDKAQTIAHVRRLIGEAEIESALGQLLVFLDSDKVYLDRHSDALQALAQYRKTRKEEAQGIISFDQARLSYNQVVNQTLQILEDLQREPIPQALRKRRRALFFVAAGLTLLAAGALLWLLLPSRAAKPATPYGPCPDYGASSAFNILLLPYRPLSGSALIDQATPLTLRERFQRFAGQYQIELVTEILVPPAEVQNDLDLFPPSKDLAEQLGANCGVRLVIWGLSETTGERTLLTTNYKFLNLEGKGFQMSKLTMAENTRIDTIQTFTSIATEGTITAEIEDHIIRLLSGIIAHEEGNDQAALDQLEGIESNDSTLALVRDMFLSDTYVRTNQPEKAEASFNRLTENHPKYWLGWYNRGVLNVQKGNYAEAVADLSRRLALDSTDAQARAARAEAFLRLDLPARAERDLEAAKKTMPDDRLIKLRLDTARAAIREEKIRLEKAEEKLRSNPGDKAALTEKASAEIKLGKPSAALRTSQTLVSRDPDNETALRVLFQAYLDNNQPEEARKVLQKAASRGLLSRSQLQELRYTVQRLDTTPQ